MVTDVVAPTAKEPRRLRIRLEYDGPRTPGFDLVERLLATGERYDGELSTSEAADVLEALEHLEMPWLISGMVEGGEQFASQIHAEMGRGLQEIVQNAQDQGAENIRFGWREREGRGELLIAHDGAPVAPHDIVFMAYPLLSGSRPDPERIGRFGIGLKTLNQLGDRLAVHCPPFSFEIRGGRIRQIASARHLAGFWNPSQKETLFLLRLAEGLDLPFFRTWFEKWDAESLLFLRRLRRLTLVNLHTRKSVIDYRLVEERSDKVALDIPGGQESERVVLRDSKTGRKWTRYTVRYPTPKRLRELKGVDKPFGDYVALSLAVPQRLGRPGRIYAALPLEEPSKLPFSLSAPFFVNVDRTALREHREGANHWLIDRLGDLVAAVAMQRFCERPSTAWKMIPLKSEDAGEWGSWLEKQTRASLDRARKKLKTRMRFHFADGVDARVDDLIYEINELDGLLTEEDQQSHHPGKRALPARFRDGGRWREVLANLGVHDQVDFGDALAILEQPDSDILARGGAWLIKLVSAALDAGEEYQLRQSACVVLADGRRLSPQELAGTGALLVHQPDPRGFAVRLGVVHQIAPAFRARNVDAKRVREWLEGEGLLKTRASGADALHALARGSGKHAVDLSQADDLTVQLRNAFEALSADERDELGPGIGLNVLLAGRTFDEKERPQAFAVLPAAAYLPNAIDKNEGWSTAAARTPGIHWLDRRYASVLKTEKKGLGALAFLRRLGAQVAPRLEAVPEPEINQPYLRAASLPLHQREELGGQTVQALLDDWVSPDLDRVLVDLLDQKQKATLRRRRARALFIALNREWRDMYAERSTAVPAVHHYNWKRKEPVSATWLARLASEPWLTTREKGLHPKAPRDLRILTGSAAGLTPEDEALYAEELDEEFADSPLAEALGIKGRPPAHDLLALLEELREEESAGHPPDQRRVQRCYDELARYCPGGPNEERCDVSAATLRTAFGFRTSATGLVRHGSSWLPPARARRGELVSERLPMVRGAPELWDLLSVREPDIEDCVSVLSQLAADGVEDRASQLRVYRRILDLAGEERQVAKKLGKAPFYTPSGWVSKGKVYAVANPALAQALSAKVPVWKPPLTMEELAPLINRLPVEVIDEAAIEPEVDTAAVVAGEYLRQDLPNAVEHLKTTLLVHSPDLYERLPKAQWTALATARVALGMGWGMKVRIPGRRGVRISGRAYLFREPLFFCALDEEEAGDMDAGGQAIASFFAPCGIDEQERAFIAMGWERAFRHRQDVQEELDVGEEDDLAGDDESVKPLTSTRGGRMTRRRRQRPTKPATGPAGGQERAERELIDPSVVDLSQLSVTVFDSKRTGRLLVPKRRSLKEPDGASRQRKRERMSPGRPHIAKERERAGFDLVYDYLAYNYGLDLTDYCDRQEIGADGVDHNEDIWVELKAHAGSAPDTIKLTPSEAERAYEKRDKYWLVIASGLEKGLTPTLVIVPHPLRRLDAYLGSGLRLVIGKTKTGRGTAESRDQS
jgi:hypothetical protein